MEELFEMLRLCRISTMRCLFLILAVFCVGKSHASSYGSWNVAAYFPNIQVLTMDRHSERFMRCAEELQAIGLGPDKYEVVQGVDGKKLPEMLWRRMAADDQKQAQGRMGCFMTHYRVIKQAWARYELAKRKGNWREIRKYRTVLIIEDNCAFGKVTGKQSASQKITESFLER